TATKVTVTPATGSYPTTASIQFQAAASDNANTLFPNTPFTWSVSDPTLGTISSTGLFTPSGKRGTVTVTATTPLSLSGTATATLSLPAASIAVVSGSGQTAKASTALPQPLVVQVSASD